MNVKDLIKDLLDSPLDKQVVAQHRDFNTEYKIYAIYSDGDKVIIMYEGL
jgi:hypothetical protein